MSDGEGRREHTSSLWSSSVVVGAAAAATTQQNIVDRCVDSGAILTTIAASQNLHKSSLLVE